MGAKHFTLPCRSATVFVQIFHQQRRVDVQSFTRAAGQKNIKLKLFIQDSIFDARQILFQIQGFLATLCFFDNFGTGCIVVPINYKGAVCRHQNLVRSGFDLPYFFDCGRHLGNGDPPRHQRLQCALPGSGIDGFSLCFHLTAFAQTFLPQRQRAGKRKVNVRVESLGVPNREAADLQQPMEYALQVQQRNICGFAALFKEDPYCKTFYW